jgi:hypothetical protein
MTIRGFGYQFDAVSKTTRWWYLKDGVKVWVDNDELVDPLPMELPVSEQQADSK